jgi:serine/threonine protein phosphatase 1
MDSENVPPTVDKVIVYLGDYIDRGPDSRMVLDMLIHHPLDDFRKIFLMGNHERMMLDFISGCTTGRLWARHGGLETLASYGFMPGFEHMNDAGKMDDLCQRFDNNIPLLHKAFLQNLRLFYTLGGYYFVHAGVHPDLPLDKQTMHDALWMRDPFLSSKKKLDNIVVHGHSQVRQPTVFSNRIAVDTGAYVTDRLSAVVLDGFDVRFIQACE